MGIYKVLKVRNNIFVLIMSFIYVYKMCPIIYKSNVKTVRKLIIEWNRMRSFLLENITLVGQINIFNIISRVGLFLCITYLNIVKFSPG